MIRRVLVIVTIAGFMQAARSFAPHAEETVPGAGTTLAAGFVLLIAFFAGRLFAGFRLPKLTGYITAGIVVGPSVLALISERMVADLRLVNGVAVCLIALTAGIETDLRALRPLIRTILCISLIAITSTMALIALVIFLMRDSLPFFEHLSMVQSIAVASVLGVTLAAQSPAVVVALREEMNADGPLIRTVLGVVVIGDLLVIVCFAVVSSITQTVLGSGPGVMQTIQTMLWELFGSIGVGLLIGVIFAVYLKKIRGSEAMFLLVVCIAIAEVGQRIHLDPLLTSLSAGIFLKNVTNQGERLLSSIEITALPVYVVFFAVAGATIHINVLAVVGGTAALLVITRALGLVTGTVIAARLSKAPPLVTRYAAFGLLPQAGLALALAMLFARTFPAFGQAASALTLGVVAINEIVAPVLFRYALVRSGEVGHRQLTADPELPDSVPPAV